MELATGALGTLLPKLEELLIKEYNLQKSVKKGIGELKAELESMQAALVKVSNVPLDQLDPQVKLWANEVRDLSYVIEDNLDTFVTRVEGIEPTKLKTQHLLKKVHNEFTKFKVRHEIANGYKDIESQVMKIKERYDRYKINDVVANLLTTTVDPRLSALYNKVTDLVGIDDAIEDLTKALFEKSLKIVSIVGFGGLGKTTLAEALYDKLNKTYECKGFVPVGQNPDTKKVLRDILLELDRDLYRDASTMDERQLINQLQNFLAGKRYFSKKKIENRYFIVIDDIWDIQTWETIKCAFMDSHPESRLIVTSCIVDVATKVGGIYYMKPLSDEHSKILFYTRTCGGDGVSEDNQLAEVTEKILRKCDGVPLAIVTIASLLVGKRSEDWSKVYNAIGFGHEDNELVHNTRKILSFSYYDLPFHLKTCLLYLSMFPEDIFIEKTSLIWRWVAEGFVTDKNGVASFAQGEIFFNALVNKSMIRLIEPDAYKFYNGSANENSYGCRVHDMVLDLIRTISNDVNFVTIHDMEEHGTCSRNSRVSRLALHGSSTVFNSSIEMEHVRSFYAITCSDSRMPLLLSFKVLRVLVIEGCVFPEGCCLEHLGKLIQLRYLGLVKTSVKLPERIGYDLKFLEILDVRGGLISELPPSVGELKNLRCLRANKGTQMKGEIVKLTCLKELLLHSVNNCPNFWMDLGKLTKMRVLEIYYYDYHGLPVSAGRALLESLRNLHKIQSLAVWDNKRYYDEQGLYSVLYNIYSEVPGGSLEDLAHNTKLRWFILPWLVIPRMPSWISSFCVPILSHLCLHVEAVEVRDIRALGRLSSLLYLIIEIEDERRISYSFGSDECPKLRWLIMKKVEITIGEGALPMLEMLQYSASARMQDVATWKKCPLMEEVICYLHCTNSGNKEVQAMNDALLQACNSHPNAIKLTIDAGDYDSENGEILDELELFLGGLDGPEEVDNTAQEQQVLDMIESLEYVLSDNEKPRLGRYGEQEILGFVTRFKSLLRDDADASTNKEEPDNGDGTSSADQP